jgi:hypothetical protein
VPRQARRLVALRALLAAEEIERHREREIRRAVIQAQRALHDGRRRGSAVTTPLLSVRRRSGTS